VQAIKYNFLFFIFFLIAGVGCAQICEDSVQSYSLFSSYKIEHQGKSFLQLSNGNNANIAYTYTPQGIKLAIILTDANGKFLRAKFLEIADQQYNLYIDNLVESPQNGIIAYARLNTQTGYQKGIAVIKFNNQLSIEWSKLFQRDINEPELTDYRLWGLHCDEYDNIYFSFFRIVVGPIPVPNVFFVKLDGQGNLAWSKGIDYRKILPTEFSFNAITSIDDKVLFLGNCKDNFSPGFIGFSLNKESGDMIRVNKALLPTTGYSTNSSLHYQNIRIYPRQKDMYYAFGENTFNPYQSNLIHFLVDTAFNYSEARRIKGFIGSRSWNQFGLAGNGSLAFLGFRDAGPAMGYYTDHFAVIDSAGKTLISKKAGTALFQRPELYPAIIHHKGESVSLSAANLPSLDSLKRIDIPLNGDTALYSCLGKDTAFFSVEPVRLQKTDVDAGTVYSNVMEAKDIAITSSDFFMEKQEFCKVKSTCTTIVLSGTSLFCTQSQQTFVARKNTECLKKLKWNVADMPVSVISETDSSLTIEFTNSWNGYFIAELDGCGQADSIYLQVYMPSVPFSLGEDQILCPGDSIVLSVPSNPDNIYKWSTGQIASAITIRQPGIYWVSTLDKCGNIFSDTIKIEEPVNFFPMIGDLQLCFRDSVFIPKYSYFDYTWQPQAGIIHDSLFFLNPASSTAYSVKATDEFGCIWYQNFIITVQECLSQIWFPTAFTPNDDALNDNFGPVVDGKLELFTFKIYNRWGELIFASDNPFHKWDGKFKGLVAPSGVYVWVCNYRFRHESAQIKKGTVTLVH
jgi:gliding motility-associated-like protein